ncbi:MAG: cyclic di-GMP phosphodiesterase [Chloroflexota bacterium]|jgi:putative two-component system response regulator|nr:cyclic di-GMP phosphodiesterase [Chloroflexota bacterium]
MISAEKVNTTAVLVVDRTPVALRRITDILKEHGHTNVITETDPWKVVDLVASADPGVIIINLELSPELDGFGVIQMVSKEVESKVPIPFIASADRITPELHERAIAIGIYDFISRPIDPGELALRTRNAVRTRLLHLQLMTGHRDLEDEIRARTEELDAAQVEILDRLAMAAEYRDDDTGDHTRRVGEMSGKLAHALKMSPRVSSMIERAAPLHDVGKIAIPDSILLKPGALTEEEFRTIKTHTTIGARILLGSHPVLWLASEIAMTHHERYDGSGYPEGLRGEDIPLPGRVVSVVDVYDTLTHDRSYREAWPKHQATAEILSQSGKQFDSRVVDAFLRIVND